jgi:hypothetical protein
MKGRGLRALGFLLIASLIATGFAAAKVQSGGGGSRTLAASGCRLKSAKGDIKHVIYIVFDNVHFLRDNPNVPSDLEQMPNLLKFIRSNGTLMTNNHTVLISHTANGILTSLTGMYPDRHGQSVTNSFRYFKADGTTASSSSFKYWTDLTDDVNATPADPLPIMVNGDSGTPKNTPAPWVPYTRAGCDFGATALANVVLENTGTGPNGDMTKVFGDPSPERNDALAAAAGTTPAQRVKAQTDYVGIAIHCAAGGGICAGNANARPDSLPDEPGGYNGFKGLFGAKYVNPAITGGSAAVNDLNGNPVGDQFGQPGFPGFDGLFAGTTLGYVAQMQEAGIPVTFGYISDAHDEHGVAGEIHIADGPGQAPYVAQLKRYDEAFGKFFARLAVHGITKDNTLFMFTNEEGDHFVGSQPTPAGCDGVNVPCSYSTVSEVNANLAGLLGTQQGIATPFTVHSDMSPTIYITGNPTRDALVTRNFGRAVSKLTAVNPITGQTNDLNVALADTVGMKALHMVTADPQRTPTLTWFAHPDYFFFAAAANCPSPCVFIPPASNFTFAWNHGSIDPEIATTFLGMVGPGVRRNGDDATWADHTDERATMLRLLGLNDSYAHDGRVLIEQLDSWAVPASMRAHRATLIRLGDRYKQLNAPFGTFSMNMLAVSNKAIKSGSAANDGTYVGLENQIQSLTSQRDALARLIRGALNDAASGDKLDEAHARRWIQQAGDLLSQAAALASS